MRLFVGISFTEEARRHIHRAFLDLEPLLAKARPSPWQGYHLTLQFLGEVSDAGFEALADRLGKARFVTPAFQLEFTGPGRFQKAGGDVLWLGLDAPPLEALQDEVTRLTASAGFAPEPRPFSPHLTLARGCGTRKTLRQ